jgi:S-DNA-T family DNA segregation ATPase FtsK/SpoIIIE
LIINNLATTKNSRVEAKDEYLTAIANGETPIFLPIVVVVDEFAELMLERGPNMQSFVDNVSSVCQTGRSTLIHLILATQRPDRKIVPGRIHANLDTKIALRVPTPADSMTVLGYGGAEKLLGSGDMLFSWKGAENQRLQGYNFK